MKPRCGANIQLKTPGDERCTSGCLVSYVNQPRKVMLLSVCHGLVTQTSKQGDEVVFHGSGDRLGVLEGWTDFHPQIQAEAALVWVDPAAIDIAIDGLAAPSGSVETPSVGTRLRVGAKNGIARESTIEAMGSVEMTVDGAGGWHLEKIIYTGQIIARQQFTVPGDSGAIALDGNNAVVGMVVAGTDKYAGQPGADGWTTPQHTIITPISYILNHPDFAERLTVLTELPARPLRP